MEIKKIKGLNVKFSENDMTIEDSYKIRNIDKMADILNECLEKTEIFISDRTINSFVREWIVRNRHYKLFIHRKENKNISFKDEQKKIKSFIYFLLTFSNILFYKLSKVFKIFKIKNKERLYKKYIKNHKQNVLKAYEEMKENPRIFQLVGKEILDDLYDRALVHDDSKYSKEEFKPYRKNFYPINQHEKEENKSAFDAAWEHHCRVNSHHWQHRQNKTSFDRTDKEQVLDVLENVLDWMAMGYQFHDRPYQYYMNNKEHIILNKDEQEFLEYIIFECIDKDYINNERNTD